MLAAPPVIAPPLPGKPPLAVAPPLGLSVLLPSAPPLADELPPLFPSRADAAVPDEQPTLQAKKSVRRQDACRGSAESANLGFMDTIV